MFLSEGSVTYFGPAEALQLHIAKSYNENPTYGNIPIGNLPEVFLDLCDRLIKDKRIDTLTVKCNSTTLNRNKSILDEITNDAIYANNLFDDCMIIFKDSSNKRIIICKNFSINFLCSTWRYFIFT